MGSKLSRQGIAVAFAFASIVVPPGRAVAQALACGPADPVTELRVGVVRLQAKDEETDRRFVDLKDELRGLREALQIERDEREQMKMRMARVELQVVELMEDFERGERALRVQGEELASLRYEIETSLARLREQACDATRELSEEQLRQSLTTAVRLEAMDRQLRGQRLQLHQVRDALKTTNEGPLEKLRGVWDVVKTGKGIFDALKLLR